MNNIYIDGCPQRVWLSYDYFLKCNIPEDSISNWSKRNVCDRIYIENRAFIAYDTIPEQTRSKLPTEEAIKLEYKENRLKKLAEFYYGHLKDAYECANVATWINTILKKYPVIKRPLVTEYARRASVFERILDLPQGMAGELEGLWRAYKRLYPNHYGRKCTLSRAIRKAKDEGVLSVSVDPRSVHKQEKIYKEAHQYLAVYTLSHNKAFCKNDAYDMFCSACKNANLDIPSYGWYEQYYYKNKNIIEQNRSGKTVYEKDSANYAKIIPALNSNSQWQMDGWRIPIYGYKHNEKGGKEYYVTYNLFTVMDAHSRMIIGYDIAESENTESILKGLERAVKFTGVLPFEIVADNHSFNKTKEADNLKDMTENLGMTWTVDSNPKRKALIERSFRTLGEKHFKQHYGYIGQGVKSKIKNGITQQELSDIYQKPANFLNYEQIVAIACVVVEEYNNKVRKMLGDSPANTYAKSEQPHAIQIDEFVRMKLFNRRSEHKITHGQITIQRGMHKYEYQLPSEYSVAYNNKQVEVRYADFSEIYLYDLETGEAICSISQKLGIHGALADQSETDKELLFKNTGRIKENNSKIRKKKESLFDAANTINPNIYDAVNKVTASKDVLEQARQNKNVRNMLLEHDITLENVVPLPIVDEMLDSSLKPRKKENKHPFAVKSNEIKILRL